MRIEDYDKDYQISQHDFVIGTDGDNRNRTKNFPIWKLTNLIMGELKNSGLVLRFGNTANDPIGTEGLFFSEGNNITKDKVTRFYFSQETMFGENISALLNSVERNLGDLYIGFTQTDDASNYGFFNITGIERTDNYYRVDATVRGSLFAKPFIEGKDYGLLFDLASTEIDVQRNGDNLEVYKNGALQESIPLSTSDALSRIISGSVNSNGQATFTRDDNSTFQVDFTPMITGQIPQKTSDLINDGADGQTPFITDAYSQAEIDAKLQLLQDDVDQNTVDIEGMRGIKLSINETEQKIYLRDGNNVELAQASLEFLNNEATKFHYDTEGKTLQLRNSADEVLDSIPVSRFAGGAGDAIQFNGTEPFRLELASSAGDPISFVDIEITNVKGLQEALDDKENSLGNPVGDGYYLRSDSNGTRYWSKNGGDKHYVHTQVTASSTWVCNHGLEKYPDVDVFNENGDLAGVTYKHIDLNTTEIYSNSPFAGQANFN